MHVDVQTAGRERVEPGGVERRILDEPVAGVAGVLRERHQNRAARAGIGFVNVGLRGVVEFLDLRVYDQRAAVLVQRDRRAAAGERADPGHLGIAGERRETQHEPVGEDLAADFAARKRGGVRIDVQRAGQQPVDSGSVEYCGGRNRKQVRIGRVLLQRDEHAAVAAGERVVYVGGRGVHAAHVQLSADVAGCEVDGQRGLARRLRTGGRDLLLTRERHVELQRIPDGHHRVARLADVACRIFRFRGQRMVAVGFAGRIPVETVRRAGVAAEQVAVDEEPDLGHTDVVARRYRDRDCPVDRPVRRRDGAHRGRGCIGGRWRWWGRGRGAATAAATGRYEQRSNQCN